MFNFVTIARLLDTLAHFNSNIRSDASSLFSYVSRSCHSLYALNVKLGPRFLFDRRQMEDNKRSIPCLVDGFKPSQRKVLFSCFKRNLKKEIKVCKS